MCIYLHIYRICLCMCVYVYIYIYIYIYICVCVCECKCVCMYICVYAFVACVCVCKETDVYFAHLFFVLFFISCPYWHKNKKFLQIYVMQDKWEISGCEGGCSPEEVSCLPETSAH